MKKRLKRSLGWITSAVLAVLIVVGSLGNAVQTGSGSLFTDVTGNVSMYELMQKYLSGSVLSDSQAKVYETRTVLISLEGDSLASLAGDRSVSQYVRSDDGQAQIEALYAKQDKLLAQLRAAGIEYELEYRYVAIDNAIAVQINTEHVSEIRKMSGVDSVVIARTYAVPQTTSGTGAGSAVTNVTNVYGTGIYDSSSVLDKVDGSGMLVAILDTGLDYTHRAFATLPGNVRYTEADIADILSKETLRAEERQLLSGSTLNASDVYVSAKIPFAYDYADNDADVYPSYSNHGTHVAGIVAGYDESGYTDKDGNLVNETFWGVAPNAQLMICKVFTDNLESDDLGGAETEDILAALEDCILMGVDVINMSLGTTCGFSTTDDGDDEGEYLQRVYDEIGKQGINLVCAASNDYSAGYGSVFGTNLSTNPDSGTVGSPATYASALAVASISGKESGYLIGNGSTAIFFENSNDENSNPFDFVSQMLADNEDSHEYEYVVIPGVGLASDYTVGVQSLVKGRIALVKRGDSTFQEKVEIAKSFGAIGIIVYNNVAGTVRMSLGDVEDPIPAISINMNAGNALVEAAKNRVGTLTVDRSCTAGPFMSDFSSWGCTPDLKLKPEITAHGGEITSTVPGGYGEMSGTSMACPNMAGVVTLLRNYIQQNYDLTAHKKSATESDSVTAARLVNQILMSTATTIYDQDNLAYSPRKQGAGLGSLENSLQTGAYLWVDDASIDYRPKIELGDDKNKTGVYTFSFYVTNFGTSALSFRAQSLFMTETLASNGLSVAEQAHMLEDVAAQWQLNGAALADGSVFTVAAGDAAKITVTLTLSDAEKQYIDQSFQNGMFVEGFIKLLSENEEQCDLVLPFMGFYGDWTKAPMLDYSAYELAKYQQDSSIADDEKPQASVWATQPYLVYYNDQYVIPMGSFLYLQDENADQIYADEEHNAISGFNQYLGEDNYNNYLTTYKFKGLYAGLLRNARAVYYTLYNTVTGEVLETKTVYRVGKAYANGGSATPAFVELDLDPVALDMASGEQYTMTFEFELDYEGASATDNTFSFSFYVDYEAPILQDVRVRYYDYKDGNKTKQRIYLDLDVFDNHYAQSVMLTYLDNGELKLATEYVTPVYNANKNGTTTVSIEITDLYEKYKDSLYVQLDDYALNHSVYWLNLSECNQAPAPDYFELADGESELTLGVFDTHTVKLNYSGDGNLSNFKWSSNNRNVADVRNGEIVGLKPGTAKITIEGSNGYRQTVKVTVKASDKTLGTPSISFGTIQNGDENLVKAQGTVAMYPGSTFRLEVQTDPWYYPQEQLTLQWASTNPDVATVDQNGNVKTISKGTAVIKAIIVVNGSPTAYTATVTLRVQDPFEVSNYSLVKYHGTGDENGVVTIPTDRNIMMIGEEAFKDNDAITEVIIPKTVTSIGKNAFENCTSLKAVYFVDKAEQDIADADVNVIYQRAFYGCTALELVDLSNVKVLTLGRECFANCTSLSEIRKMVKVATAYDRAFANCAALTSLDLTGLRVCGSSVFAGCSALTEIQTSAVTKIGDRAFTDCTALRNVVLHASQIGAYAFDGCTNLRGVTLRPETTGGSLTVTIGAYAFAGCEYLKTFACDDGCRVLSIGDYAFAETGLTSFTVPSGLQIFGTGILSGTSVREITIDDRFDLEAVRLTGIPFSQLTVKLASDCTKYVIENGVLYNRDQTCLLLVLKGTASVSIPSSVTSIGAYAFAGSSVTSVTVPSGVISIGEAAFADSDLTEITFAPDCALTAISASAFSGSRLGRITIPASVRSIGESAFANSNLSEITFVSGDLETIGSYAFAECNGLVTVALPNGVKTLGDEVFALCKRLQTVTIPSATKMGSYGFYGCESLASVTFGNDVRTLGTYTFYSCGALTDVTIGSGVTEILQDVFFACSSLTEIDLGNVTAIGKEAFAYCTALGTVTGLERVETIGDMAFYNVNALKTLNLAAAKTIGKGAFAVENGGAAYTEVKIPAACEIGVMAFLGGRETTVTIPATLQSLGYGAFSSSKRLTEFVVADGNEIFFATDGVLFRHLTGGGTELSAFPGGKSAESGSYTVPDGTVRIAAYAFADLSRNAPKKVVLPWSLKLIGVSAFYNSGILDYTFHSIQAPMLACVYRDDVMEIMEQAAADLTADQVAVNGLFYANFDSLLVNYLGMVGGTSDLTMHCPENGTGYDNFVYTTYFGTSTSLGVLEDDTTRDAIDAIEGLESVETVQGWQSWEVNDENRALLEAMIETVKEARRLYNCITDQTQLAFVSENLVKKLTDLETELRSLRVKFGIALVISDIRYNTDYKKNYVEGENFDMTGLILTIVYDDGSTELADLSRLTLVSPTDGLTLYDAEVYLSYRYGDGASEVRTVRIPVTVSASGNPSTPGGNGEDPTDEGDRNLLPWIIGVVCVLVLLGGGAAVLIVLKKRSAGVADGKTPETTETESKPEIEPNESGASRAERKPIAWRPILKWVGIGVLGVGVIALAMFGIKSCGGGEEDPLAGVQASIHYYTNGGEFDNHHTEKTIGYRAGSFALNIGFSKLTNGNVNVNDRDGYVFEGWYLPATDGQGNLLYDDAEKTIVTVGAAFDFSKRLAEGEEISLYAKWVKSKSVAIQLVGTNLTDSNGKTYAEGSVVRELVFRNGNAEKYGGNRLVENLPRGAYTFVEYYSDADCTQVVSWPIAETDAETQTIYAKFIAGDWDIVSDVSSATKMLGALAGTGHYYLIADIDLGGAEITTSASVSATVEGNGHTLSNFSVTKKNVDASGASLLGTLKSAAALRNLTLSNVSLQVNVKNGALTQIYFLFTNIENGAQLQGLTVTGNMTVQYASGAVVSNIQPSAHDKWIVGGDDATCLENGTVTVTATCKIDNATYTYPEGQ